LISRSSGWCDDGGAYDFKLSQLPLKQEEKLVARERERERKRFMIWAKFVVRERKVDFPL